MPAGSGRKGAGGRERGSRRGALPWGWWEMSDDGDKAFSLLLFCPTWGEENPSSHQTRGWKPAPREQPSSLPLLTAFRLAPLSRSCCPPRNTGSRDKAETSSSLWGWFHQPGPSRQPVQRAAWRAGGCRLSCSPPNRCSFPPAHSCSLLWLPASASFPRHKDSPLPALGGFNPGREMRDRL